MTGYPCCCDQPSSSSSSSTSIVVPDPCDCTGSTYAVIIEYNITEDPVEIDGSLSWLGPFTAENGWDCPTFGATLLTVTGLSSANGTYVYPATMNGDCSGFTMDFAEVFQEVSERLTGDGVDCTRTKDYRILQADDALNLSSQNVIFGRVYLFGAQTQSGGTNSLVAVCPVLDPPEDVTVDLKYIYRNAANTFFQEKIIGTATIRIVPILP